ncbi:F0F1 ATP synthase subunit epsilon [Actinomadura sp. HBU206391]|uniref:F0F1 ATP synthase subunit epsilon n=1 Tax=Actinomadura sp. HBU206391 TaxID=2731692 RepID=UPI00164EF8A9|nr:F0F1 ATP synthase subunit epsilon [Actinomadura sp. HBU206391]MBC6458053.1 F0F1 ATP synthase subunit epsilon [Actinomadura sp. HBU206391]
MASATLKVGLVSPEREIWSGEAEQVIAQTIEGEMGILVGHVPVLGVLVDGSVVRIKPVDQSDWVTAMVGSGFFSVAGDEVAVLAEQAELGAMIDVPAARAALQEALEAEARAPETVVAERRARARLRAAGEEV